jgi:hypothetical protein
MRKRHFVRAAQLRAPRQVATDASPLIKQIKPYILERYYDYRIYLAPKQQRLER